MPTPSIESDGVTALDASAEAVSLGHVRVDKPGGHLVLGQVGDGCLDDLVDALAAVALEDLHPLVELGAGEIQIGFHALAEWTVLLVVKLPELAHDAKR